MRGQQSGSSAAFAPTGSMGITLRNGSKTALGVAATPGRWSDQDIYVPIRWRCRYNAKNYLTQNASSMETDGSDWTTTTGFGAYTVPTVAGSAVRAWVGSKSVLITWPTTAGASIGVTLVSGLTIGRTYTFSAYVYVPTGSPDVRLTIALLLNGSTTPVKDAWTRISVTWTATQSSVLFGPRASGTTAGQQCWVDGVQVEDGSSATTYANDGDGWVDLWRGHVVQWQYDYAYGNETATITAAELPALLSRIVTPPLISAEQLADGAVGAWPLTDEAGVSVAADWSGYSQDLTPQICGDGGTVAFGSGAALGPEGGTVATFTRTSATSGAYLLGTTQALLTYSGQVTLEAIVKAAAIGSEMCAAQLIDQYNQFVTVGIDATGHVYGEVHRIDGSTWRLASTAAFTSADTVMVTVACDVNGLNLYVNGSADGFTILGALVAFSAENVVIGSARPSGGVPFGGNCWSGEVSYVAAYPLRLSAAQVADHYEAAVNGHTGDLTHERFARLCEYAGLATERYTSTAGASTMCAQPTAGSAPNTLLEQVADAEQGIVLVDPTGRMVFQPRAARYNASPSLTLDASTGVLASTSGDVKNDADLVTMAKATRPGGAMFRASAGATALAKYGTASEDLTLLVDTDAWVQSIAQHRAMVSASPTNKLSSLTVSMVKLDELTLAAAAFGLDISDVVRVSSLPTAAISSSLDLFVEGVRWDLNGNDLRLTLFTSAATVGTVWVLGSSTYGRLDSTTILAF